VPTAEVDPETSTVKTSPATAHWASLEETGILWGMRVLLLIYRLFGRFAFRWVLRPVVTYYFLRNGLARRASRDYLARLGAYFPDLGITGGLADSYRHFLSFAETLLDKIVVWMVDLGPERVEFHNRHLLLELMDRGQGAILLGAHLGNLEICRALAELRDPVRLNILVHTKHAEKFNRLLGSVERLGKIELIQVTELNPAIAIRLKEKIGQGEFVVMVGDRVPIESHGRTVRVPFLGAEAEFPQGPYLLASLLQCPVFTLLSYPWEGKYHIYLESFAESIALPRRDPQRGQELKALARRYAETLEYHCHRAPLQWFNFFPFWGTGHD
jgi:predicted LPLAT superfamily acyltransferase